MAEPQPLALFPLNTVLFPSMPLLLHVFEARYREMIGVCLDQAGLFGVVRLAGVPEVGVPLGAGDWEAVGTVARIISYEPLPDGRYALAAQGVSRFTIQSIEQESPYAVAHVAESPLPVRDRPAVQEQTARLRTLYDPFLQAARETLLKGLGELPVPSAPEPLAWFIAATLPIEPVAKQRLLEKDSLDELIAAEIRLLEEHFRQADA